MTASSYLTVKALTKYIKRKFDADPHLRDVYVMGELSNVKKHTSGHIYFTLKDEGSRIQATMFRAQASKFAFVPTEGMKVFIRGDVNVYEQSGSYQLYAHMMEPDGIGGLFVAFNQLKERLEAEGLFQARWKQPIPAFPKTIGVLTATTGAAIRDICTTIQRRYPLAEICIYPTLVQGKQAAANIAANIALANAQQLCDVLIVGRGGGSIEDLWAFNEEVVARAIFESRIPIISAVGHETDTTIADFAADLRAPTPTAAAELAVPNQQELFQQVLRQRSQLHHMLTARLRFERGRLTQLQQAYPLAMPTRLYRPFIERFAQLTSDLERASKHYMRQQRQQLTQLQTRVQMHSPKQAVAFQQRQLEQLTGQLTRAAMTQLQQQMQQFQSTVRTLEALNPLALMSKGFSVTYRGQEVIKRAAELHEQDVVTVQFEDGTVQAQILQVQTKEANSYDE